MTQFDARRRKLLVDSTAVAGGVAIAGASVPFLVSLAPSERARSAGAPVELDVSKLQSGELATAEWRGKPVWVLRRTSEMLARLDSARSRLTDPDSTVTTQQPKAARNATRSINPEIFVTVSLCTHLGCIPSYYPAPGSVEPDWPGGWYCPCHGSKFDLAGRVFKGSPAPTNLVVPPHAYVAEGRLVIGEDQVSL
ncbi:MAG: ubiquinol-cytochrome c reductase iron-sulfur subunit [Betaproteobacteria bacterium]|nr:MAG: ubiquinol-cytochrome c reductase iron-sulfur subunit [Betaproteobacteria bacterium]